MAICDTLKAFSDSVRQKIMVLLKDGKMTAGELSFSIENYTKIDISYFKKYINMIEYILEVLPSTVGRLLSSLGVQAQFT